MKVFIASLVVGVMITMVPQPAQALESLTKFRANGQGAAAEWFTGTEEDFTDTFVATDQTKDGTFVFVGRCSGNLLTEEVTCMSGETTVANSMFTVDRRLNTASLAATTVTLWDFDYLTSEEVTVAVDWTATSPLQRGRTNVHWMSGEFMENYHDQTQWRDASASGTWNEADLGDSSWGQIIKYRLADMILVH
ncbi:MAG: hypothetical protein HYY50_04855 [Candidatus Kerfeldbacteria bacterium]|nr:hypothetical protein [Candidatus Kerfeldbacteria bacterium]